MSGIFLPCQQIQVFISSNKISMALFPNSINHNPRRPTPYHEQTIRTNRNITRARIAEEEAEQEREEAEEEDRTDQNLF